MLNAPHPPDVAPGVSPTVAMRAATRRSRRVRPHGAGVKGWTARIAVALLATLAWAGCATITRGTIEALVIETDPAGATASVSGGLQCTTPCALLVKRSGEVVVAVDKEGYEPVRKTVVSGVEGAGAMGMAGNYLLGPVGIAGALVDYRSGAAHSRKPNPLVLEPLAQPAGQAGRSAERETSAVGSGAEPGESADSPVPADSAGAEPSMEKGCR